MPPKRRTFVLSVMPATSNSPVPRKVARKSVPVITHPGTSIMVIEALKELDSRKGVSKYAIQNFIMLKYPSVDRIRINYFVRRALKKGLENGTLVRPANSTITTGIIGKFRLAPKRKEPKAKAENVDPNVQKAPEAAKEAPKKTKAGGTKKKAAAEEPKSPTKDAAKGTKKSKKDEEALRSKVAPAKKPKVKKAADEVVETKATVRTKAKPKEVKDAAATKKTKAKKGTDEIVGDAKATVRTKAKSKEVKEAAAAGKTKAKPKEAKVVKAKAAKDSDKEPVPKAAAKQGRKKNAE
ncbi:protein B4 [Phycodurus eques]|uniref:protein B4 n=1 Tax=Phycodurus eques TaxID=693459 RepID=UPI002ACEBF3B|nr:protein B4 [Phycodurus eques]